MTAILFDMGGVLLDFKGSPGVPEGILDWRGREALLRFLHRRNASLSEDDLEREFFGPWRSQFERRHELGREADWSAPAKRLRKCVGPGVRTPTLRLLSIWFRPLAEQVEALPDAREVLEECRRRGHRLAVVSNVALPGALYRELLDGHGLGRLFERMYFSYDEGSRKPSPAIVRRALADLAIDAAAACFVGDRRGIDVLAGRAAGVRTIWLRSDDGGGPEPDATIDELTDLLDVV